MTKSILITGCSSGIGYAAAHMLQARGWRVFATVRKPQDRARLEDEGFESAILDYADPHSVRAGLAEVLDRTDGRLDALFNNGAYGLAALSEDLPRGALEELFATNVFGLHDLTRQVIPVMRAQGHGRIINHSSVLGLVTLKWRAAYAASKYAVEGLTDTLRLELAGSGIHVSTINTGLITTKFRVNSIPPFEKWIDWEASARADEYRDELLSRLNDGRVDRWERPPEAVVRKVIHALESPRPRPRYFITLPAYVAIALKRFLPLRAQDWVAARF